MSNTNALAATTILLQLMAAQQKIAMMLQAAHTDGGRDLTTAELDALAGEDDAARARLQAAIAAHAP